MKIVLVSCPMYADVCEGFYFFLNKFWPDRKYDVEFLDTGWAKAGADGNYHPEFAKQWSDAVADYADKQQEPLLLVQDDRWLSQPIDSEVIAEGLDVLLNGHNAGVVRLVPEPAANQDCGLGRFGFVQKGTPYRVSAQPSIWDPKFLSVLARESGTPYSFELEATQRAEQRKEGVLAPQATAPWPWPAIEATVRGSWSHEALELTQKYGLDMDFSKKPKWWDRK